MLTIYGIKNCSTMKKAFVALDDAGIDYEFYDYKKQPPTKHLLTDWIANLGMDTVLNKRGMTWRKLTDEQKQAAEADEKAAIALMIEKPSMIKRPILQGKHNRKAVLLVGFNVDEYASL